MALMQSYEEGGVVSFPRWFAAHFQQCAAVPINVDPTIAANVVSNADEIRL